MCFGKLLQVLIRTLQDNLLWSRAASFVAAPGAGPVKHLDRCSSRCRSTGRTRRESRTEGSSVIGDSGSTAFVSRRSDGFA
jgi:hypothetical protein